jgi:hypothetical protein
LLRIADKNRRTQLRSVNHTALAFYGFRAGGISTIGGFGFGFAGTGAAPGGGLTSIGGGNGAACCWLTAAGGRDAGG